MKVLWLTNTPVGASDYLEVEKILGGWMNSLELYIKEIADIDLAVCFFHQEQEDFKFGHNGVTYYPLKIKNNSFYGRVKSKLFDILEDENNEDILKVIGDFKPDVIQLFGTESGLGNVLRKTDIPIIVHIQALVNPYLASWFPSGTTQYRLFLNSPIYKALIKKGFLGHYYLFKKRAKREEILLKNATYFFGRTDWDRRVISLYNSDAQYFHCAELLRKEFFEKAWASKSNGILKIATTINPNVYKGLEIILQTANILKNKSKVDFEWTIIGIDQNDDLVQLMERMLQLKFKDNHVTLVGYKKVDELIAQLLASDVFVHPSHADNSPNSVCEAMLLGMPVFAGYVGGVPSLIEHNVNGILYNSHDPYDLASYLSSFNTDGQKFVKLANNAKSTALKRHDAKTIVNTIRETYEILISNNQKKRAV